MTLADRLWKYIDAPDMFACWIWMGSRGNKGYGRIRIMVPGYWNGRLLMAHRVMYELYTGRVLPTRIQLDHMCEVEMCVNPSHMYECTNAQNNHFKNYGRHAQDPRIAA